MMTNPILDELHEVRRQILAEHGSDLRSYLAAEFEKAKASGHPVAEIRQRRLRPVEAASESDGLGPTAQ